MDTINKLRYPPPEKYQYSDAIINTMSGESPLVIPDSAERTLERLELIGNSVQGENPAPDNPQEIKSCGRKSKNLFDAKKAKSGWITTDGKQTLVTLGSTDNVVSDYIQVYPGMKYTSSARVFQNFYDSEKNFLNHNTSPSTSIVVPDNAKYMIVVIAVNKVLAIQTANTLMINIGSSALPYEQYTNKYLLDVKVTGKNLFNREKAKDESNWKHISGYQNYPIYVGTGNKVTFSYLEKLNTGLPLYFGVGFKESSISEYMYHATTPSLIANKKTLTATGDYAYLIVSESNVPAFLDAIQTFQVEISPTQTNYKPYKEQTLTLTSDRPITKWDRLVEQGGQIGWLYGGVVIDRFDGQSNKISIANKQGDVINFSIRFENVANGNGNSDIFVDKYRAVQFSYTKAEYGICCNWNDGVKYFSAPNENVATVDEFKAWLVENPLKIAYETTKTEFVPLPQSEQDVIRALKTYYPTTVITADGGELDPDIKVTYTADTKNYIDGKVSAKVASIISQYQLNTANLLSLMPMETQATMIENDTNNILGDMEVQKHE